MLDEVVFMFWEVGEGDSSGKEVQSLQGLANKTSLYTFQNIECDMQQISSHATFIFCEKSLHSLKEVSRKNSMQAVNSQLLARTPSKTRTPHSNFPAPNNPPTTFLLACAPLTNFCSRLFSVFTTAALLSLSLAK